MTDEEIVGLKVQQQNLADGLAQETTNRDNLKAQLQNYRSRETAAKEVLEELGTVDKPHEPIEDRCDRADAKKTLDDVKADLPEVQRALAAVEKRLEGWEQREKVFPFDLLRAAKARDARRAAVKARL